MRKPFLSLAVITSPRRGVYSCVDRKHLVLYDDHFEIDSVSLDYGDIQSLRQEGNIIFLDSMGIVCSFGVQDSCSNAQTSGHKTRVLYKAFVAQRQGEHEAFRNAITCLKNLCRIDAAHNIVIAILVVVSGFCLPVLAGHVHIVVQLLLLVAAIGTTHVGAEWLRRNAVRNVEA